MVRAAAGGVAYSRDPVAASQGRERVVLNAVSGLPQAVVDGAVTPDVFAFSRENPPHLLEKHPADAEVAPSLTDAQAAKLARVHWPWKNITMNLRMWNGPWKPGMDALWFCRAGLCTKLQGARSLR